MKSDYLVIDGKKFDSRLIMGTSLYPNLEVMNKSLELSETQIITVAIRRLNLSSEGNFLDQLKKEYTFLPNTAGCFTQKEAILTAELARETLQTNWIKLELMRQLSIPVTNIIITLVLSIHARASVHCSSVAMPTMHTRRGAS